MTSSVSEGAVLWEPSHEFTDASNMSRYMRWLAAERGLDFDDYAELWRWSVDHIEDFWASIWDFFDVQGTTYLSPLATKTMPGARWFPGATLNYVDHIFRNASADRPALIARSELRPTREISWAELRMQVVSVAQAFRAMGVSKGDRVAALMPNIPETVVAFLACASIGAIWSTCSPDFGTASILDRFTQIEPRVLIAVNGYQYGGKTFDKGPVLADLQANLPSLEHTVLVPYLDPTHSSDGVAKSILWDDLLTTGGKLTVEPVAFDHPLWVLYTSGTTGLPKPIVHGHGGIILEHLKSWALHLDLKPDDRFFWFTTTGWTMWNLLVGGLLVGSTVVLYDGSPAFPDLGILWRFAADTATTTFGTSAAFITTCMKEGHVPRLEGELGRIRTVGSTGSPLSPEGYAWVYEHIGREVWLVSMSGGTDVCAAFVGGCPLLPVWAGEIQAPALGVKVEAWDESGKPLIDHVGELVVTEPMPSMPVRFWNDEDDHRYRESYFDVYPGVWRHGDWIRITGRGSAIIYGRSDSTLNRMGIRIGTSDIYRAVEEFAEVLDSLVVDLESLDGELYMPLFVVLEDGTELSDELRKEIRQGIRDRVSPRHVPDDIFAVPEIPKTLNGKKLEVPVKKLLMGTPPDECVNPDSMANPASLEYFVDLARARAAAHARA